MQLYTYYIKSYIYRERESERENSWQFQRVGLRSANAQSKSHGQHWPALHTVTLQNKHQQNHILSCTKVGQNKQAHQPITELI